MGLRSEIVYLKSQILSISGQPKYSVLAVSVLVFFLNENPPFFIFFCIFCKNLFKKSYNFLVL